MEIFSNIICESVLDDIERSNLLSSSAISNNIASKDDYSVWLIISVYKILKSNSSFLRRQQFSKMISTIDDYFRQHPAVKEHSIPQLMASDDIIHQFKIGFEVCFRSMRQYVKFFFGLLSVIESLQDEKTIGDCIEVDSDSDPWDSTWRIKRATALENLIVNAQSFDFEEDEINRIMDDIETYRSKWRLSEVKQSELKESILDDLRHKSIDLNDQINREQIDDYISYKKQIIIQIFSSNLFKGPEFNPDLKIKLIKDILDSWNAYVDGYSNIEWNSKPRMFSFNMSRLTRFYSPARMERFLKCLLDVCGPAGFLHHRALYILKWDDNFNQYRYVVKEYYDYDSVYDYHSHFPRRPIDDICKILIPIGELFGITKERIKTYVQNKFEYDDFAHPNPRYKGERFGSLND